MPGRRERKIGKPVEAIWATWTHSACCPGRSHSVHTCMHAGRMPLPLTSEQDGQNNAKTCCASHVLQAKLD